MNINTLILLVIGLVSITLTACSKIEEPEVDPLTRQTYCNTCKETFTLPPGYLGTLQEDGIQYSAHGIPTFICPKCGEHTASPMPLLNPVTP